MKDPKHDRPMFQQERPRPDDGLACAIKALGESVAGLSEQNKLQLEWFKSHFALATLHDLKQLEKRLLMTSQELETLLNNRTTQIIKISAEQAGRFDVLTAKIDELTKLIEAGGAITPSVVAAAEAVGVALDSLDAAIPDAVPA